MRKTVLLVVVSVLIIGTVIGTVYIIGMFDNNTAFDKNHHETWYDASSNKRIKTSDVDKIKEGMSFEEIVSLIGKPKRDVGSGAFVLEWDMESDKKLQITFNPMPDRECEGDLVAKLISIVPAQNTSKAE